MSAKSRRIFFALYIGLCLATIFITAISYSELFTLKNEYILENGEPLGGDFIAFYTGGSLVHGDTKELYNFKNQYTFQEGFYGEDISFLPFLYPPSLAYVFSLLTSFSLKNAYFIWALLSCISLIVSIELLLSDTNSEIRKYRGALYLGALAFTPFTVDTIAGGQLPPIGLIAIASASLFIKKGRYLLAGLLLSLCYYKPPLYGVFILGLAFSSPISFVIGFILGTASIFSLELITFGASYPALYTEYINAYFLGHVAELGYNVPTSLGVGIYSELLELFPSSTATYLLLILGVLALVFFALRKKQNKEIQISVLLLFSLALSPQVNNYDIALLIIPIIYLVDDLLRNPNSKRAAIYLLLFMIMLHCIGVTSEGLVLPVAYILGFFILGSDRQLEQDLQQQNQLHH